MRIEMMSCLMMFVVGQVGMVFWKSRSYIHQGLIVVDVSSLRCRKVLRAKQYMKAILLGWP